MRIIDADRYQKDLLSAYDDLSMELEVLDRQPLVSAIPIPEGATNGDMVKIMFPNLEIVDNGFHNITVIFGDYRNKMYRNHYDEEWWNAPYKSECNLSEKPTGSESEDEE